MNGLVNPLGFAPGSQGSPADSLYQGGSTMGAVNVSAGDTNVHVAGLIVAALVVIVGLHYLGFRFVVDASVGR